MWISKAADETLFHEITYQYGVRRSENQLRPMIVFQKRASDRLRGRS